MGSVKKLSKNREIKTERNCHLCGLSKSEPISQDTSYEWPISYMKSREFKKGDILFKKGDKASKIFYIKKGSIKLEEINKRIGEGAVIGEMGLFSPFKERTATAVCETDLFAYTMDRNELVKLCQKDCYRVFNLMQLSFKRFIENITRETEARERIKNELRIAREIQMSMLPRKFPPFPDRKEFDIFATIDPAKEVGGDFYDFFFIDQNKLCLLIGDVSGKGVPAALFMAISKTSLKTEALDGFSPEEILYRVNNILIPDNDACMFVTLFCLIINVDTGEVQFSNGGHNPPLVYRDGGDFEFLDMPKSCVIGVMENAKFEGRKLMLKPNDMIFLYTDGVTEAMNPQNQLFTETRLKQCLSSLKTKGIKDIISGTQKEIHSFVQDAPQSDDITILSLKYKGKEA